MSMNRLYLLLVESCFLLVLFACSSSNETPASSSGEDDNNEGKSELYEWTSEEFITSVEAESGDLKKVSVSKEKEGYSGEGYLTGFWNSEAEVSIKVEVPEKAMYRLKLDYLAEGGNSHFLIVNGKAREAAKFTLPVSKVFGSRDMGKYLLNKGTNTITFKAEWGDVLIDRFSVYTASKNVYNIDTELVDANANEQTRGLYRYLLDNFGKKIISGFLDGRSVEGVAGCRPALYGWDLYSYTEGYPWKWSNETGSHVFGAEDNGNVKAAIDWYKNTDGKGIVTLHWHWTSPKGGKPGTNTFYTEFTTFDVTKAVEAGTEEYQLILRDIDAVAIQLKRLEAAGVPVLWRPLHEAGGGWFWWGAKGPEACLKLYDILFDRLNNYHGIHNLIWVWSSNEPDWYPGNDKVDIIGYDSYPGNYNVGVQPYMFNDLYHLTNGRKIIAMTENGPIPNPDACLEQDAPWALFMSWGDLLYEQNQLKHIIDVFHNSNVITVK